MNTCKNEQQSGEQATTTILPDYIQLQ